MHKILNSTIDSTVTKKFLIAQLGKPNEIWKEHYGEILVYYTWDIRKMPKDFIAPEACTYIAFVFSNKKNYLTSMTRGDMDL